MFVSCDSAGPEVHCLFLEPLWLWHICPDLFGLFYLWSSRLDGLNSLLNTVLGEVVRKRLRLFLFSRMILVVFAKRKHVCRLFLPDGWCWCEIFLVTQWKKTRAVHSDRNDFIQQILLLLFLLFLWEILLILNWNTPQDNFSYSSPPMTNHLFYLFLLMHLIKHIHINFFLFALIWFLMWL